MFEFLYTDFDMPGFFRLFSFVTFRALLAGIISLLVSFIYGPAIITRLRGLNYQEVISEDGPDSHQKKTGTPTMGGLLILSSLTIGCVLFGNFKNMHFVLVLCCTLALGAIGFLDDYSKVVWRKKNGLNARWKMLLTLIVAGSFCIGYYLSTPDSPPGVFAIRLPAGESLNVPIVQYVRTGLFIPFHKGQLIDMTVFVALPFWMLVMVGSAHAVNLTDGLDGLAVGMTIIVAGTMGVIAYITGTLNWAHYLNLPAVTGAHELTVFLAALTGAGVGFLWYNAPPAQVFMGDTGSLAIGGALGMTAVVLKKEILLVIAGGVFVMETLSVILQVASFRLRGVRIFRMAPLHHHFELKGWPETRVVIRFWLLGIIFSLLALSTLRLQ